MHHDSRCSGAGRRQTDGRTDDFDSNTTLCTVTLRASRGEKILLAELWRHGDFVVILLKFLKFLRVSRMLVTVKLQIEAPGFY